jgi:hypothetical protein
MPGALRTAFDHPPTFRPVKSKLKTHSSRLKSYFSICVFSGLSLFTPGCQPSKEQAAAEVMRDAESLMKGYFEGSVLTARFDLQRAISLVEDSPLPIPLSERSAWLSIQYLRLHELERRFGNEADTAIALQKARYWRLRRYESSSAQEGKPISAERKKEMLTLEPAEITRMVVGLDRAYTSSRGPKFDFPDN